MTISFAEGQNKTNKALPAELKRLAVSRILGSEEFVHSPKLCDFLNYIVEQDIAGRSNLIKGKTIAVDVYGRDPDEDSAGHNIVRVEARRLRRSLEDYYQGSGANDAVRLYVDPGGYVPRFVDQSSEAAKLATEHSNVSPTESASADTGFFTKNRLIGALAAIACCFITAIATIWFSSPRNYETVTQFPSGDTRVAMREYSVATLQAKDLALEARELYFPVFDARRQNIALGMYEYAIELSPYLLDGHAGAAQVLATLHMIAPEEKLAAEYLARSQHHANLALEISASDAWSVAAKAWVLAQEGKIDEALAKAQLASKLAPSDGHILDLLGVTAIYANAPEFARNISDPERPRDGRRSPGTQNIWGLANLMLGNNRETIKAFENGARDGAAIHAVSLIFLAVAYDRIGYEERALSLVQELNSNWPSFPTKFLVERVFPHSPELMEEILDRLQVLQTPT